MELGLDGLYDIKSYSTCDRLIDATRKCHTVYHTHQGRQSCCCAWVLMVEQCESSAEPSPAIVFSATGTLSRS